MISSVPVGSVAKPSLEKVAFSVSRTDIAFAIGRVEYVVNRAPMLECGLPASRKDVKLLPCEVYRVPFRHCGVELALLKDGKDWHFVLGSIGPTMPVLVKWWPAHDKLAFPV